MKKTINNPSNAVSEMLAGIAKANPKLGRLGDGVGHLDPGAVTMSRQLEGLRD